MPVRAASAPASCFHGGGVAGGLGGASAGGRGGVAGGDDGFERAALVLDVALGGLDQVGDQVVAPLELDIDLREGVLEPVAQRNQPVVRADRPQQDHHERNKDNQQYYNQSRRHNVSFLLMVNS